jgi:hypothetical protein
MHSCTNSIRVKTTALNVKAEPAGEECGRYSGVVGWRRKTVTQKAGMVAQFPLAVLRP